MDAFLTRHVEVDSLEQMILRKQGNSSQRVVPGLAVYDRSRGYLGIVTNAFGAIFSVDVEGANVWLDKGVIAGIIPGESVALNLDRDELGSRRLDINPAA
jgi:hypothetical protein